MICYQVVSPLRVEYINPKPLYDYIFDMVYELETWNSDTVPKIGKSAQLSELWALGN